MGQVTGGVGGDDNPSEFVIFQNSTARPITAEIFIEKFSGADRTLKLLAFADGPFTFLEFDVAEGSIFGHAAVNGAMAVASINAGEPGNDNIAFYSSQGPVELISPAETRQKPDITAIDGVNVTGAGGFSDPFFWNVGVGPACRSNRCPCASSHSTGPNRHFQACRGFPCVQHPAKHCR